MKLIAALFIAVTTASASALAQEKAVKITGLSPLTRHYIATVQKTGVARPEGYVYRIGHDGKEYLSAIIKVTRQETAVAEKLKAMGAWVGTKAGIIWTVDVPVEKVLAFTTIEGIDYIQLDEPVIAPKLNVARRTTRVDSVHKGYNLPMGYSGKNVIMGIIDFGFDYNHPTFYDTMGTGYRVRKVWELNGTGTPPADYNFGRELADTTAIKAQATDNAVQTHGTAVAGTASGSGWGGPTGNASWRGMAYDAQMVFVGVRRDSIADQWRSSGFADFINGIDYIFKYADAQGKPAVVNISWGSQSGPHDGTTLFNQACDALTGAGKIIVMSAGNEGEEHIHMEKTFTPTDTSINSYLTFSPNAYQRTWVDIWGEPGKTFAGRVKLYRNGAPIATTVNVPLDNGIHNYYLLGSNTTDTCYVEFINSLVEFNSKPRMTMNIFNKTGDTVRIEAAGQNGRIHLWNEYYYYGYKYRFQSAFSKLGDATATEGDTLYTVSDMGAAQSVLLVGAYASKVGWTNINGGNFSYASYVGTNKLVPFSSRGPLVDGRIKPDITAPGVTISTAVSSYDTAYTPTGSSAANIRAAYTFPATGRTYYYGEFTGTSAASPAAAGIVALMLQAAPALTPQQAKTVIFQTAIQDVHTGTLPAAGTNSWGHGKINAYGALKILAQSQGIYQYTGSKLDCVLFPNPASGSFMLDYTSSTAADLDVAITDVSGRVTSCYAWTVGRGQNTRSFDISALAKGTYLVQVAGKEGAVSIKTVVR